MDAAAFVIDNFTDQIAAYDSIAKTMRADLAGLPDDERAEIEAASAVLRQVRSGGDRKLLPLTIVQKDPS